MSLNKKSFWFLFFMFFPGVLIKFGGIGIPLRYLSLFFLSKRIFIFNKESVYFLVVSFNYILVILVGCFFERVPSILDISYIISFFYMFCFINFIREQPHLFFKFLYYFTWVNIVIGVLQNSLLIIGVGTEYLMFFENIKPRGGYIIPPSTTLNYTFDSLFRVPGLFHESAPLVIYLIFSFCFFFNFKSKKHIWLNRVTGVFLILSGSKLGFIFVATLLIVRLVSYFRIKLSYLIFGSSIFAISIISSFYSTIENTFNAGGLGSIFIRFNLLYQISIDFFLNFNVFLFGKGVVPSSAIYMMDTELERGLDFFSIFIYGNGILGSFLILSPIVMFFKHQFFRFPLVNKNMYVFALALALLTSGSLTIMQYAVLAGMIFYLSEFKYDLHSSTSLS